MKHLFPKYLLNIIYCYYWGRRWHPTPVLLLENPMDGGAWCTVVHGVARSRTQLSDFTFNFHFPLSCIGEGNGNPLQCSCLENPRDRGAWWAADYWVTQSRTRLTWLSSSSIPGIKAKTVTQTSLGSLLKAVVQSNNDHCSGTHILCCMHLLKDWKMDL